MKSAPVHLLDLSTGKLDFEAPPADELPNGNYKLVMKDEDGKPFSLRSKANAPRFCVADHWRALGCDRVTVLRRRRVDLHHHR